ncbi:unnamed protein product [Adineta steineri]|uniref:Uncharacterized protein n=1 Tax=Adineta steineri TaxID=433720 RepID=A0A819F653_9BILA|nr:unnamed protein product [Adineta steineri]
MGHLLTKMTSIWLEQQNVSLITQNSSVVPKSINIKRKRTDQDDKSNKRKITYYFTTKNDNDDDDRLSLSPRVPPVISKPTRSSNTINRSLQTRALFKCQLCHRYLKNKDIYMDHMMMCAIQRQASIKIVRTEKDKDELSILC